jgi:hypothetical protein
MGGGAKNLVFFYDFFKRKVKRLFAIAICGAIMLA